MKKQHFVVNHGTYPYDILVCIGYSDEEANAVLIKKAGISLDEEAKEFLALRGEGRTCMLKGGQTVIRINSKDFYPTLAHEVFHAVEFLFDKIGIKYDLDKTGEAYAYQIKYLMGSILEKAKRS